MVLLLAAILGYLLGGPLLAIGILIIGVAVVMVRDVSRMLVDPMGLGIIAGYLVVRLGEWLWRKVIGAEIPLTVWFFATHYGFPVLCGLAVYIWWERRKSQMYRVPSGNTRSGW